MTQMDAQRAVAVTAESDEWSLLARSHRRLLVRGVWLAVLALTLVIAAASFPAYLTQLQTTCGGTACEYQQLTTGQAETLTGMGLSLEGYAAFTVALLFAGVVVCWAVSALIIWRSPDERIALLVALLLLTFGPLGVATALPAGSSPWLAPHTYLLFLAQVLSALVFLLFPSGRFAPRWTRWALVALLVTLVPALFLPTAPLLPYTPSSQLGWLVAVGEMMFLAGVQLYRYRRVSSAIERQQTKWVVVGLVTPVMIATGVTALALGFPSLAESSAAYVLAFQEGESLFSLCLPLGFGLAILRFRLWDVDALINRALVYGILTVILAGIYMGLVISLQALLRILLGGIGLISQNNSLAIVISTLTIVVLIRPLRHRVQALIDRRFYRRKYDAKKILETFRAALRQEADADQLRMSVLAVAQETMQPVHISLWLNPTSRRDSGDSAHRRLNRAHRSQDTREGASLSQQ
jgi:hypothetical protein